MHFDPLAVAIDWLDAYRAGSHSILGFYTDEAGLDCGCGGRKELFGRDAIAAYWRRRFAESPAGELLDLQLKDGDAVLEYRVNGAVVKAVLRFDGEGRIRRSFCGPPMGEIVPFRVKRV